MSWDMYPDDLVRLIIADKEKIMAATEKCLVQSESCDWYIIPENKRKVWYSKYSDKQEVPNWAEYVELSRLRLIAYREV